MRVLHVNKFLYRRGGAEAYMEDVAALQVSAGHEVAFFGMDHPDNPELPFAAWFPSYLELEPPPAGASERVRALARVLWSRQAKDGIAAVLDAFGPDVVHLHNIYHHLSPSVLKPIVERRIPAVMTLHDYKLVCPVYTLFNDGPCERCVGGHFHRSVPRGCKGGSRTATALLAVETALHSFTNAYGRVGLFLCPSRFLADKMSQGNVFPDRLRVLNNFVAAAPPPSRTNAATDVLYAGRLWYEKGVDVLVRAAAALPPPIRVVIAGEGPERQALERLAEEVAPGRVVFTGRCTKASVSAMASSAAIAAMPSRWHENQPMWVLEAAASGLPVVATSLGGLPELVEDGVTGILVDPEDPAALAAALSSLFADRCRAREMGAAGRRRVLEQFSPQRHLVELERLYREVGAT